jgi:hypothetical protein
VTGVVAYDLIAVLKILKKENWVTSEEYNNRLRDDIYGIIQNFPPMFSFFAPYILTSFCNDTHLLRKIIWITSQLISVNFDCSCYRLFFYEAGDQPSPLKKDFKQERLKDKAMANSVHLRKLTLAFDKVAC